VRRLEATVEAANTTLQGAGRRYADACDAAERAAVERARLEEAARGLRECRAVARLCRRAQRRAAEGRLVAALAVVERVRALPLRRMRDAAFGQFVAACVPHLARQVGRTLLRGHLRG
jgi:hypothetical protein